MAEDLFNFDSISLLSEEGITQLALYRAAGALDKAKNQLQAAKQEVLLGQRLFNIQEQPEARSISAQCHGSGGEEYQVSVLFESHEKPDDWAEATCSCPVAKGIPDKGENPQPLCKHSLALMLWRVLPKDASAPDPPKPLGPAAVAGVPAQAPSNGAQPAAAGVPAQAPSSMVQPEVAGTPAQAPSSMVQPAAVRRLPAWMIKLHAAAKESKAAKAPASKAPAGKARKAAAEPLDAAPAPAKRAKAAAAPRAGGVAAAAAGAAVPKVPPKASKAKAKPLGQGRMMSAEEMVRVTDKELLEDCQRVLAAAASAQAGASMQAPAAAEGFSRGEARGGAVAAPAAVAGSSTAATDMDVSAGLQQAAAPPPMPPPPQQQQQQQQAAASVAAPMPALFSGVCLFDAIFNPSSTAAPLAPPPAPAPAGAMAPVPTAPAQVGPHGQQAAGLPLPWDPAPPAQAGQPSTAASEGLGGSSSMQLGAVSQGQGMASQQEHGGLLGGAPQPERRPSLRQRMAMGRGGLA